MLKDFYLEIIILTRNLHTKVFDKVGGYFLAIYDLLKSVILLLSWLFQWILLAAIIMIPGLSFCPENYF